MMSSSSWPGWLGSRCAIAQRVADAARNQRDLKHIGVHRRDGEQADEAVLDRLTRSRIARGPPRCRVGAVAQVARHGGLRQHQQIVAGGELRKHVGAQPQHAETTGRIDRRTGRRADLAALVTQQHEVPVGQPAQQRARHPGGQGWGTCPRCRSRVRAARLISMAVIDVGVQRHLTGLGENAGQQALDLVHRLGVDRIGAAERGSMPRRCHRRSGASAAGSIASSSPLGLAPRPEHRIHDGRVGHAEPVQQHRDGVHQHRRVVGDDLQRGPESSRVVVGVHRDAGVTDRAVAAQSVVGVDHGRRHQPCPAMSGRPARSDRRVGAGRVTVGPVIGRHVGPREASRRCPGSAARDSVGPPTPAASVPD